GRRRDRQARRGRGEHREMDGALQPRRELLRDERRVGVAGAKHDLEEEEAGHPHRRGPAEPGQDRLPDQELDLEEEERGEEDGDQSLDRLSTRSASRPTESTWISATKHRIVFSDRFGGDVTNTSMYTDAARAMPITNAAGKKTLSGLK